MKLSLLPLGVAAATAFGAHAVSAQDYYFIEHKATEKKLQSCAESDGEAVLSAPKTSSWDCVQWERVPASGEYFHLRNKYADRYLAPGSEWAGAWIKMQPKTWTGNWTQWSYQGTGDGYGYIINRSTDKQIYVSSGKNAEMQPRSWSGDYTRWKFTPVDGGPTPTPTSTPASGGGTPAPQTPTPTPTSDPVDMPTPGSSVFEAESANLIGNAETYPDGAASGGMGVAYVHELGDAISFSNVPASTSLSLRYALENAGGKISVRVNSADAGDITFASTGAWVGAYETAGADIQIPANSTVDIFFDSGDTALNIDTVTFTYGSGGTNPTPTPTPTPPGSTVTPNPDTPTPRPTPTTPSCGAPAGDPVADYGDGKVVGLTKDGIAYHMEQANIGRGFAIWGLAGSAPNVAGQQVLHTTQSGEAYYRYETEIDVSAGGSYSIEMRLQGDQFGGGQCIQSWTLAPGEFADASACYTATGGGEPVEPPKPPAATSMVVTDAVNGKARLVGGPGAVKPGFALYTFQNDRDGVSNCSGGCEDNWPKVIVPAEDSSIAAGGVTGKFGVIPRTYTTTDECGNTSEVTDYHVTYNDKPLYYFVGDQSASDTTGKDIANWALADANLIPQLPLVKHPAPALKTTINGIEPNIYGFAIDIDGRTITWRPGANAGLTDGLISQFSPWGGYGAARNAKDPNLEFYCSNNQIQFHKADMPGVLVGPYKTEIPASCYGKFYYFLRYRMYGTWGNGEDHNFVYTALFEYDETKPEDRIDPSKRPTVTYKGANWQRHRHPHARDGIQEAIYDASHNNSLLSGLERYETEIVDGPDNVQINIGATTAPMRLEILEWGAGVCAGPQYVIGAENAPYPNRADVFNYGQILTWEASFPSSNNSEFGGGGISSQVYNTYQHNTVGQGFTTSTGDPRLNPAGRASTYIVHSPCNPSLRDEQDAIFTQHLTSITDKRVVNDFILGHHVFHGVSDAYGARASSTGFAGSKAIVDVNGKTIKGAGETSCGDCHYRDGRSNFVVETAKGPRLAPPTYGTGLLEWIEGADVGLTWDGSVPTVKEQATIALANDHGLTPAQLGQTKFDQMVTYTEMLHVPVRDYGVYRDEEVAAGEVAFMENGCAGCHQPTQKTRSDAPVEFADLYIRPYTDMKLHDVGTGGKFRTPPLWGIGRNIELLERDGRATLFLHNGSATSLEGAISAHANAGSDMQNIVKFLKTL